MRVIYTVRVLSCAAYGNKSYSSVAMAQAYQRELMKVDVESELIESEYETHRQGFVPPTLAEVRAYAHEKGYTIDAECFIAFYESKGWKIGKEPMKSWRGAVVTWAKRSRGTTSGQSYREGANDLISHF